MARVWTLEASDVRWWEHEFDEDTLTIGMKERRGHVDREDREDRTRRKRGRGHQYKRRVRAATPRR